MASQRGVGAVGLLLAGLLVAVVVGVGSASDVSRDRLLALGVPLAVMLAVFLAAVLVAVRFWRA